MKLINWKKKTFFLVGGGNVLYCRDSVYKSKWKIFWKQKWFQIHQSNPQEAATAEET